jgi:hypothetical protein
VISDPDLMSRLTSAGQISFALHHINNMKRQLSNRRNKHHEFTIGSNQVPQKTVIKLGLSHQRRYSIGHALVLIDHICSLRGSLDNPQPVCGGSWTYNYVNKARDPFISFTFKYRSLGESTTQNSCLFIDYYGLKEH